MVRVDCKPISVNEAYTGKRYKTPAYKAFKEEFMLRLKPMEIPDGELNISFTFGLSNFKQSDWDNCIKASQDVICEFYGFNDNRIVEGSARKVKVSKGNEFIQFEIKADKETNEQQEAEE